MVEKDTKQKYKMLGALDATEITKAGTGVREWQGGTVLLQWWCWTLSVGFPLTPWMIRGVRAQGWRPVSGGGEDGKEAVDSGEALQGNSGGLDDFVARSHGPTVTNFSPEEKEYLLRLRRLREDEAGCAFHGKDSRKSQGTGGKRWMTFSWPYLYPAVSTVNTFLSSPCIFIFVLIDLFFLSCIFF